MALTEAIKRKFAEENGVSLRELSKHPSRIQKIFSSRNAEKGTHPSIGRGYPFFGKTIDTKAKEEECLANLQKW